MEERPSLRPLAPLLGVLAAMWLAALGLIAQQLSSRRLPHYRFTL